MLARFMFCAALVGTQFLGAAPPAAADNFWLPGPDGTGRATYAGSIDRASGGQVSGWVVDTSAQGWSGIDDVQVWGGLMAAGGQLVAHAAIQLDRPDVAMALSNPYWRSSGYFASVPLSVLGSGTPLYVYVHTPSKGWWYEDVATSAASFQFQVEPVLDLTTPTPLATVHSARPFTIQGLAYDTNASPDQGTGVDRVQVYLDGDRSSGIFIGEASLGKTGAAQATADGRLVNAGWQLTFQPNSWMTNLSDNQISKLTVYAHSAVTGRETSQTTSILISVP